MLDGENRPRLDRVEAIAGVLGTKAFVLLMTTAERARWRAGSGVPVAAAAAQPGPWDAIATKVLERLDAQDKRIEALGKGSATTATAAAANPGKPSSDKGSGSE